MIEFRSFRSDRDVIPKGLDCTHRYRCNGADLHHSQGTSSMAPMKSPLLSRMS